MNTLLLFMLIDELLEFVDDILDETLSIVDGISDNDADDPSMNGTGDWIYRLFWILQLVQLIVNSDCSSRDKRQLIYPPQSIMQLAFGVVTPAQVKGRQIATNMGIMFNIDLPTNVSMWYPYRTDYRRKRSSDNDQILYNLMENVLSMNGFDGRACLQKSICQMRDVPIQNDNILLKILNLIFGFNQLTESFQESQHHNATCDQVFPMCQQTPIDLFIELFSSSWNPSV